MPKHRYFHVNSPTYRKDCRILIADILVVVLSILISPTGGKVIASTVYKLLSYL
jgi:hypothetical protein